MHGGGGGAQLGQEIHAALFRLQKDYHNHASWN